MHCRYHLTSNCILLIELPSIHLPPSPKFTSLKNSLKQYCDKLSLEKPVYFRQSAPKGGFLGVVTFGGKTFHADKVTGTGNDAESRAVFAGLKHLGYISQTTDYTSFSKSFLIPYSIFTATCVMT